jgi:hypothetical protein
LVAVKLELETDLLLTMTAVQVVVQTVKQIHPVQQHQDKVLLEVLAILTMLHLTTVAAVVVFLLLEQPQILVPVVLAVMVCQPIHLGAQQPQLVKT